MNPPLAASLSNDEAVSFMPMAAVDADSLTAADRETRAYSEVSKGYTPFLNGDVLVAKITPCFENGKIAQARLSLRYGFGSTEFHVVRPRGDRADARYLTHFLRQDRVRKQGESRMTGSAGQRRVPEHFLAGLAVPLPPLPEQRRIAEILDKADALRAKRRAALAQLDTLTQSIFLDMFGDSATNPKGWPLSELGTLLRDVTNGMTRRRPESEVGQSIVLRLRDIREGWIDFSEVNRITLSPTEAEKYEVVPGDLLFIRVNGNPEYVGRCALFAGYPERVYFNDHVMRVRIDAASVDGVFLALLLNGSHGKREIAKHRKTSAGQHTINQDGLNVKEAPLNAKEGLTGTG
ncbi:MAG: restriction endonuclease subunit S, partial [Candidatus Accumulibacter sp.]|nr:restriction endonuclease subunit S [Accumulibacter sp.]